MTKHEAAGSHLNDVAYEGLRDLLVHVRIAPGTVLNEDALSDMLGVGLTPVRSAIRRLAFEWLVSIYPRRGTFAADINIGDELWLTELRLELEGMAAQQAALRANDDERAELLALAGNIEAASSNSEVTDLDAAFHRRIFQVARNPFLERTANMYFNLSLRIWYFCDQNFALSEHPGREQVYIAEAILHRDEKTARTTMQAHLTNSSTAIRRILSAR